jgi:pimeloyl-ACP methyl ester carboxylesterase
VPDQGQERLPTVVFAHSFSAVKDMFLDHCADASASSGLASVVFDNRNFGASDGMAREEIDPWQQVRDYRDAVTFTETLDTTEPDRSGIWDRTTAAGTSWLSERLTAGSNALSRRCR